MWKESYRPISTASAFSPAERIRWINDPICELGPGEFLNEFSSAGGVDWRERFVWEE